MKKVWLNYALDVIIGIAFVITAISGIVFLAPVSWINLGAPGAFLGLRLRVWDVLHTYGGLTMTAGVLGHLVLHWKWLRKMTSRLGV